jgi:hypothetical protein
VHGAAGYHDHNWGEWIPTELLWNWASYHEPGFGLALGDFRNWPTGVLGVDVEGERVVFEKGQYLLIHTQWAWNAETGIPPGPGREYDHARSTGSRVTAFR